MLQSYRPDLAPLNFHMFGPLKQHLEGCQFHNNEEVEMAVVNGYKCRSPVSTMTVFLTSCQDGTNVSMCLEIMMKNNDTSVE
jgi:hypothetical protein